HRREERQCIEPAIDEERIAAPHRIQRRTRLYCIGKREQIAGAAKPEWYRPVRKGDPEIHGLHDKLNSLVARECAAERGMTATPRIDLDRLLGRLDAFNRIGALPGGGNCRLALSDEDRAGRDLLVRWMRDLGLTVTIDAIGNIFGVRGGRENLPPVMFGS